MLPRPEQAEHIECPVCLAVFQAKADGDDMVLARPEMAPSDELGRRVARFAAVRGYSLGPESASVIKGLLEKNARYGDFFCPCRFDNVRENICPCDETRAGSVELEGHCY
jgi:hypothetical protein